MRAHSSARLLILGGAITAVWASTGLCFAGVPQTASVIGSVVLLDNKAVRTPAMDVRIAFHGKSGRAVEAATDAHGKYRAILPSGDRYEVVVEGTRLCTIHRPAFGPEPGATIRFDFIVAFCGNYDSVELDLYGDRNQFQEERIALSKNFSESLILSFGLRHELNSAVHYEPLQISANVRLPITASFGTYTVSADTAVLDGELRTFRMEGHVSVADGGTSPPVAESCIMLQLDNENPQIQACPEKHLELVPIR